MSTITTLTTQSMPMLNPRSLYPNTPPDVETRDSVNPTLLMSWWATCFSLVIILVRFFGRYARVERFFPEDKWMMVSAIPLLIRMAFVHVVLIWGTNNTKLDGLTPEDIRHRQIGSKLVLAARIFYAVFIWSAKFTVCGFLKRVSGMIWRRSVTIFLRVIYGFLASTLIAVVIATLTECRPFHNYWQVIPDPGPKCRSGYAHLITMGVCDVITDLLLVAFPIPIVLMSNMPLSRRISLAIFFSLSLILVAITCYRVPAVIHYDGSQQYRSLLASMEVLAATAVSNAVIIGSFVRDRGVKKPKYKKAMGSASVTESMGDSSFTRANLAYHQWGSDADLAADLGIRLHPDLHFSEQDTSSHFAPIAHQFDALTTAHAGALDPNWSLKQPPSASGTSAAPSIDMKVEPHEYIETNGTSNGAIRSIHFHPRKATSPISPTFDVGDSLLPVSSQMLAGSEFSTESSGITKPNANEDSDAGVGPSSPVLHQQSRNGSKAFLQGVGG